MEQREARREAKALVAAKLNKSIEKELLDRLRQGTYEGVYNFPEDVFDKTVDGEELEEEEEEVRPEKLLEMVPVCMAHAGSVRAEDAFS